MKSGSYINLLYFSQVESTKIELSRKEAENGALHTQIETLQRHWEDHERHITVLRDQIGTKEEQGTMLQADVSFYQSRTEHLFTGYHAQITKLAKINVNGNTTLGLVDPDIYVTHFHSFRPFSIEPLQDDYSEALPAQTQWKRMFFKCE